MKQTITVVVALFVLFSFHFQGFGQTFSEERIDEIVLAEKRKGNVPGMAVAIIQDGKVIYEKGFGFSDVKNKKPILPTTLFELASCTKAFTALAALELERKGLLSLDDKVSKYLPWFDMQYESESEPITISELIYHLSGLPYSSFFEIPRDDSKEALQKAVEKLAEMELTSRSGKEYQYANGNYSILGLVLETVTGQSYEQVMEETVFKPLGLKTITANREEAYANPMMATGYKWGFFKHRSHEAPNFGGNSPGSGLIASLEDMERWVMAQLDEGSALSESIGKSHQANEKTKHWAGYYGGGWAIFENDGTKIFHSGGNPDFASFVGLDPDRKTGVIVLANTSTAYATSTGRKILTHINGWPYAATYPFYHNEVDKLASTIFLISLLGNLILLISITKFVKAIRQGVSKRKERDSSLIISTIFNLLAWLSLSYILFLSPQWLFMGVTWEYMHVWFPFSIIPAHITVYLGISGVCFLTQLKIIYTKPIRSGFPNIFFISYLLEKTGMQSKKAFKYITARVGLYVTTFFFAAIFNFFLYRITGADPIAAMFSDATNTISPELYAAVSESFSFATSPLYVQFVHYIESIFTWDLGYSVATFPQTVSDKISYALVWTLYLMGSSTLISFCIGTTLGIFAASKRGEVLDNLISPVSIMTQAFPPVVVSMLALFGLGVSLKWLPIGYAFDPNIDPAFTMEFIGSLMLHSIMPVGTLVLVQFGGYMILMRNNMVTILNNDFIIMGEAKGLSKNRLTFKYAARNAILPSLTYLAVYLGMIFSGALITETAFNFPGLGYTFYTSILKGDYPVLQGLILITVLFMLVCNFIIDIFFVLSDPQQRS